jgi:hypothetical protein
MNRIIPNRIIPNSFITTVLDDLDHTRLLSLAYTEWGECFIQNLVQFRKWLIKCHPTSPNIQKVDNALMAYVRWLVNES